MNALSFPRPRPRVALSTTGAVSLTATDLLAIQNLTTTTTAAGAAARKSSTRPTHPVPPVENPVAALEKELITRHIQEEARPILRLVREHRSSQLEEVQEIAHRLANARVIDSWNRSQRERTLRAAAEKERDLKFDAELASAAAAAGRRELEAEAERRRRIKESLEVVRRQQDEQAERRALDLVRHLR
jgi:hypothetical protein